MEKKSDGGPSLIELAENKKNMIMALYFKYIKTFKYF